jgi:hypothetical protein
VNMKNQVLWQGKDRNLLRTVLTRQILLWREAHQFFAHVSNRESPKASSCGSCAIRRGGKHDWWWWH